MSDMRSGWALAALALVLVVGCVKTSPTMSTTRPGPQTQPASDVSVRLRELSRLSEEYGSLSRQLPGRTSDEHRELLRKVFTELGQILPLLKDPRNDLVFHQQLAIIEESRTRLATGSSDLAVEPTIDTGLRAAHRALAGIAQIDSYNQAEVAPQFDQMSAKIDELDTVHGLTHQVVVGEVVELSSGIISKMVDALGQRLSVVESPTTAPSTTAPAVAELEATAPSTAAAVAPAGASGPATKESAPPASEPLNK